MLFGLCQDIDQDMGKYDSLDQFFNNIVNSYFSNDCGAYNSKTWHVMAGLFPWVYVS